MSAVQEQAAAARERRAIAALALPELKRLKAERAEYEEERREAYRQGFAPHYCPHGMNLWVSYDPICGPCEDGATVYELALAIAHTKYAAYIARCEWFANHPGGMPQHVIDALVEWVVEPLRDTTKKEQES